MKRYLVLVLILSLFAEAGVSYRLGFAIEAGYTMMDMDF